MYQLHDVEGALELITSPPLILPVARLYSIRSGLLEGLSKYQIYFILRRPRISIVPGTLHYDGEFLRLQVIAQVKDQFERFEVNGTLPDFSGLLPAGWVPTKIWADDQYPSSIIYIQADCLSEGEAVEYTLTDFLMMNGVHRPDLEHFSVDYIGHSLGKGGVKGAIERLVGKSGKRSSHEHLQKILVELNSKHPDQEAFVALFSFEGQRRLVAGGATQFAPVHQFDDDPERVFRFIDHPISRSARIKLAEASLIRYFRPKYNDRYKDSFPQRSHRILDTIREIDMTGLLVGFSTDQPAALFYTETIKASHSHQVFHKIRDDEDRASILDL
ncbi:hypothetical protein [Rhizobium leguminosarum]|uniref:hypothetical protein n=1 Tax=Rhizobium leguminosarum TaxID=384 RepID=UPI00144255E2|nr:hypothetical protein [Rhizobium leguminosarum]MBY5868734.1 hypothetical protein [Rhizobium leguminosarum]NKM07975.1 hypothetical protein [Rhizobium leguminosarum bv. viciae]